MGWLAGAMAGAGSAGVEQVDLLQKNDLQSQRDARLNEWKAESDKRLAEREDARDAARATREDARWNAQAQREDARNESAERRHRESQDTSRAAIAQREAADLRRHEQLIARISASSSGNGDKAEDRETRRLIDVAKEYREGGNMEMANKVLESVLTRGKEPPALPPKPKSGAPAPAAVRNDRPSAAAAPSPAMQTDPDSPAGKFQARQASRPGSTSNAAATQKALFILESGDVAELHKFQSSPEFNSLDRDLKQTISNKIMGR